VGHGETLKLKMLAAAGLFFWRGSFLKPEFLRFPGAGAQQAFRAKSDARARFIFPVQRCGISVRVQNLCRRLSEKLTSPGRYADHSRGRGE
jgi:hypothetical protein